MEIPAEKIKINDLSRPTNFDIVCDLMEEIKKNGMTKKIIVRKIHGDWYLLIDGLHRFEAALRLGLTTVPVRVV